MPKIDCEELVGHLENAVASLQECWDHLRRAERLIDPEGNFEIEQDALYDYMDGDLNVLADELIKQANEPRVCENCGIGDDGTLKLVLVPADDTNPDDHNVLWCQSCRDWELGEKETDHVEG